MMFRKLPPYTIYLIIVGGTSAFFTMMGFISAIYRVQAAGLNPLQLVLLGTALELSVFAFEVPTGIVADLYSRRLSVIVGYALIGAGFMLEGALPLFATILMAQVVWGIGYTFTSGAQDAWLADEIGEEGLAQAYLRASQVGRAGTLVGLLASIALGRTNLAAPFLVSGGLLIGLALFLALFMPETGFAPTPRPERTSWQKMGDTFRDGLGVVRGRPLLMLILSIALFFGLSSEGIDRLWEAHMLENFTFPAAGDLEPVVWFGIISFATLLLGFVMTEVVRRRVDVDNERVALLVQLLMSLVVVASVVAFGLASGFGMAVAAVMAVHVFRGGIRPLYWAWINKQIEPRVRATVLSMNGQVDAIGQVVGGPILGGVATSLSLRAAMVGVGLLLAPVTLLYGVALRRTAPEAVAAPAD